ncbi:glycosidase [Mycoplasmopsis mustelae]|uniref:Alpha-amylase n=1 Tax=Mycoplasmopsis mustelae TaxID=171289 RepID=A0A4R7UE65_9BACT|nr:alpha-amylase family glycosyl hydrolase [Mycoplasmopsis mustelae]TDV24221.1 glycosidase [Mycoplasmopsis mustelae]
MKISKILSFATILTSLITLSCAHNYNKDADIKQLLKSKTNLKGWNNAAFVKMNQESMQNLTYADEAENQEFQAPFIKKPKSNTMYQLTVYSFADGNNDGIGDFIGLSNNLDYFINLGIDTLYLSPFHPASTYHGYDVIDYTKVAPELGGMSAFDTFIKKAHQNGIRVVMDMVLNHTSYEHPWFQKALLGDVKYQNYYHFIDGINTANDTNLRQNFKNVNHNLKDTNKHYIATFWAGMPDLNLNNPDVLKEINYIHEFWTKKGIDGFRYDAFYHYFNKQNRNIDIDGRKTAKLFTNWRTVVETQLRNSNKANVLRDSEVAFMFGEWWKSVYEAQKYQTSGIFNQLALGSVIDGVHYKYQLHPYITSDDEETLINNLNKPFDRKWMPFLDNHDVDRWIANYKNKVSKTSLNLTSHQLTSQERSAYLAAIYSLLSRGGLPILYNGNELLMQGGNKAHGDANVREAFYWKDLNKRVYFKDERSGDVIETKASVGEGYLEDIVAKKNGAYELTKQLILLRKQYPSLSIQDEKYIVNPSEIIVNASSYPNNLTVRKNDDDTYILVVYSDSLDDFKIELKSSYHFNRVLINQSFKINGKIMESTSPQKIGVFLISRS